MKKAAIAPNTSIHSVSAMAVQRPQQHKKRNPLKCDAGLSLKAAVYTAADPQCQAGRATPCNMLCGL